MYHLEVTYGTTVSAWTCVYMLICSHKDVLACTGMHLICTCNVCRYVYLIPVQAEAEAQGLRLPHLSHLLNPFNTDDPHFNFTLRSIATAQVHAHIQLYSRV